jgi:hypothetical protein
MRTNSQPLKMKQNTTKMQNVNSERVRRRKPLARKSHDYQSLKLAIPPDEDFIVRVKSRSKPLVAQFLRQTNGAITVFFDHGIDIELMGTNEERYERAMKFRQNTGSTGYSRPAVLTDKSKSSRVTSLPTADARPTTKRSR